MSTSFDYFSVSYEHEAAFGKSTNSKILLPVPDNKREIPCNNCKFELDCANKMLECSAFRNWSAKGDYKDSDVSRYRRHIKY